MKEGGDDVFFKYIIRKKMIYKNIHGRLGNQMFQYASIKGIARKNKIESDKIVLNFKNVYKNDFENELQNFNLYNVEEVENNNLDFIQKILIAQIFVIEKIIERMSSTENFERNRNTFEKKFANFLEKFGICRMVDGYYDFKLPKRKKYFFSGGFESSKYFEEIREEILKDFTPKYGKVEKNKSLYIEIENTNSVCISIRRGDFLDECNIKKHFVCNEGYFKRAVEIMKQKVENPKFIVFSDDIQWCKENLTFPNGTLFESGEDPVWEKLRLMYSCKNFIISNSTFSWWAQYLSRNKEKVVIAPNKWKNSGVYQDIYEKDWILIDT